MMIRCGEVDLFKRLRRPPTKWLGYARVGSNPAVDVSPPISPYGTIGSAIFL